MWAGLSGVPQEWVTRFDGPAAMAYRRHFSLLYFAPFSAAPQTDASLDSLQRENLQKDSVEAKKRATLEGFADENKFSQCDAAVKCCERVGFAR
jgi:hypothetical protein